MKSKLKLLLAGLLLPVGATTIFGTDNLDKKPLVVEKPRPYVIEVISPEGDRVGEVAGISKSTDPFVIAQDLDALPNKEDKFSAFPDIRMGIGSKVTIYRAPDFTIFDGRKKKTIKSWSKNVGDLLAEAGIPGLGVDDKINFSLTTETQNNMEIRINRVAKTTVIQDEPVKFTTVKKPNPNMEKGNKKVLQPGKNGVKKKYFAVTREDGVEISRKLSKTEIAQESVDEIVEVGTKVVTYGSGKATWYKRIDKMVAAHNSLPKGTKVRVVNTANGKSCLVTIDDRGIQGSAIIDLSSDAFAAIGSLGSGVINVRVEKYYPDE